MNLRRLAGTAAGLLLLTGAAVACSSDESVENAEAGECIESIDDLSGSGNITELPEVECTDDHEGEVIGLIQHSGDDDDYPGADELQEDADEECQGDLFEDYTGTTYDESAIVVHGLNPTEASWENGDRETICVASTGEAVDVSFEDNGEDFLLADVDPGDEGDEGDDDTTTTTESAGDEEDEEDTSLEDFADLIESCEGGDLADCDTLYLTTPPGSEAEEIGATCGGREDELPEAFIPSSCEEELG